MLRRLHLLLVTRNDIKTSKFLVKPENLKAFIDLITEEQTPWTFEYIKEWSPLEKKEPLTRKEREEQPKEPIPLSRFEGSDDLS